MKNFDIGGVQFDVATVSQVKSCSPEVMADETNPSRITCTGSSDTGDNGHYALTTKTHNIKAGPIDVEVYANYGFDSKAVDSDARLDAAGRAGAEPHQRQRVNKVILRYSDNSDNSVYNKTDDLTTVYASFEGSHNSPSRRRSSICWPSTTTTTARIIPITVKLRRDRPANVLLERRALDRLEAGYQRVDYDQGGITTAGS